VSAKLFLGEYWTGATGDFQNVRARLWQLAHYGYFGPPLDVQQGQGMVKEKTAIVEKFWRKLEDQTSQILSKHAPEVHAVAQALLDQNDLTGKQCIEIIRSAANGSEPFDSENLLKALVEETISGGKPYEENEEKKPRAKQKKMTIKEASE
jgi:ATP-dependent Zn protease